ncbi:MAG: autotransporter outer membrane beta-barrel domain-containing protein [Desulfofustis sp.]|nr:autotransporter outer membrane beta-barrel domain-containing protein [Desulfofustis sp.]
MNTRRRLLSLLAGFCLCLVSLLHLPVVSAESLSDIDREIQAAATLSAHRVGLDAWNISAGVTTGRLDRKIKILQAAGVHPRFYQTSTGRRDYGNFYSFTSTAGVTDTGFTLVTTADHLRLYRRGSSGYKEALGYLGSWWGDQYRGIEASRNEQAILAAWGSDLQRIYVIDVPAGYTLVRGMAAPMEKNGEYRGGGADQYYYRGALSSWLVYALHAPDYLKSYSGAITGAQRAGRSIAGDLSEHLRHTRHTAADTGQWSEGQATDPEGTFWLRSYGSDVDSDETDGSSLSSRTGGMSVGWQRLMNGAGSAPQSKWYLGLMLGQGASSQIYEVSAVETDARAMVGGIYGLYVHDPEKDRSWYGSWSLLLGRLDFDSSVPGELGYGLNQEYDGMVTALTVDSGVSLRQGNGWSVEPQVQFNYTLIGYDAFRDHVGARVSLQQGDSLRGRLGLEIRKFLNYSSEQSAGLWTRFSYLREFLEGNEVNVAGDLAVSEAEPNSYFLTFGSDVQLSRNWSLQGQIEKGFGGEEGIQGNLAVKIIW